MKLLLDQGLPRSAAETLRGRGVDCLHVGELGMSRAADQAILDRATAEGRIVATLDADFHTLLALAGASGPSVIRIRIEGLRGPQVATLISEILSQCGEDLRAGALVSVEPGRIRSHRLPVAR